MEIACHLIFFLLLTVVFAPVLFERTSFVLQSRQCFPSPNNKRSSSCRGERVSTLHTVGGAGIVVFCNHNFFPLINFPHKYRFFSSSKPPSWSAVAFVRLNTCPSLPLSSLHLNAFCCGCCLNRKGKNETIKFWSRSAKSSKNIEKSHTESLLNEIPGFLAVDSRLTQKHAFGRYRNLFVGIRRWRTDRKTWEKL